MINPIKFEQLRDFGTTSWAVWSETGDTSVEFFRSRLDLLHGRVIFVGLNRSNSWSGASESKTMANFHARGHVGDRRLKRHIQDAKQENLIGGLMTDVSEVIETQSGVVIVDPELSTTAFIDKVVKIDESMERQIICFGDKVFNTFKRGLGVKRRQITDEDFEIKSFKSLIEDETWYFHRVWHYSNYGKLLHKSESDLPLQLELINNLVGRRQAV